MRNIIEYLDRSAVDDIDIALADQPAPSLDGVERASFGPVSMGAIFRSA